MPKESELTNKLDADLSDKVRGVSEEGVSVNIPIVTLKTLIQSGTSVPYIDLVSIGDDKGLIFTEQISVGSPAEPKESVFGGGDSYGVGLENDIPNGTPEPGSAWYCTMANTDNAVITSATDVSVEFSSDTGSAIGLFNGVSAGNYILIGSEYKFDGVKIKTTVAGVVEPDNVVVEHLINNNPTWSDVSFMSTNSNYPYEQRGDQLSSVVGSEQWRFGFDPLSLPIIWDKVSLNINGTIYTKYWTRIRITSNISTDPVVEQIKLHTDRMEINSEGVVEFFGKSRPMSVLQSGIRCLINNAISVASNENVVYETNKCVAAYTNNKLNNNAVDSTLILQNIEYGIDTSVPLLLEISYLITTDVAGNIEWRLDIYDVADDYTYDGSNTSRSYSYIDSIPSGRNLKRSTKQFIIPINHLTEDNIALIKIERDATNANTNDTLPGNVVITNVKLSGVRWRL